MTCFVPYGFAEETSETTKEVTASGNDEDISALRSAVTLAREDYLQDREALASERLRSQRLGAMALLLLLVAVGSTAAPTVSAGATSPPWRACST